MTLTYFKDQGQIYLDQISYAGNITQGVAPTNYVKFYRDGSRSDAPAMYSTNFPVATAYRVKTIDVVANGSRVRAYSLSYGQSNSAVTGRSLLSSITEYGSDAQLDGTNTVNSGTCHFSEPLTHLSF